MIIALFVILSAYLFEHIALFIGMVLNSFKYKINEKSELPSVSIIVAARNEENNIGGCIESLLKLDYPHDKLEIILMNDRSTDNTKEVMLSYIPGNPVLNYLETIESDSRLKGKTNALSQAIKKSK